MLIRSLANILSPIIRGSFIRDTTVMPAEKGKTVVIIPVYNRPIALLRALESVSSQTLLPARLLVVDDGSTDETAKRADEWIKETRVPCDARLLRATHAGAAAARNKGLVAVHDCDFVLFLDSDDVVPPDFLARTVPVLAGDGRTVAASVPRLIYMDDSLVFSDLRAFASRPQEWMFFNGAGVASCTLLRLSVVRELGGFDEKIPTGHDMTLFVPLAEKGTWKVIDGRPTSFARIHSTQTEAPNLSESHERVFFYRAFVREQVFGNLFSSSARPYRRRYFKVMAYLWYRAGLEAVKSGAMRKAQEYYIRSIRCHFLAAKPYVCLIMLWLRLLFPSRRRKA